MSLLIHVVKKCGLSENGEEEELAPLAGSDVGTSSEADEKRHALIHSEISLEVPTERAPEEDGGCCLGCSDM